VRAGRKAGRGKREGLRAEGCAWAARELGASSWELGNGRFAREEPSGKREAQSGKG
jgi:hypothetical protein